MADQVKSKEDRESTTTRIKEAAHQLFLEKGYVATSIREIAESAGTNVALLNYHFGSKMKLFEVVMLEKIALLLEKVALYFQDLSLSLEDRIKGIARNYIDFLLEHPDVPMFILNEIRSNEFEFMKKIQIAALVHESPLIRQLKESGGIHPVQFLLSIIGMIVFPFLASPLLIQTQLTDREGFRALMLERQQLIPIWVESMLTATRPQS